MSDTGVPVPASTPGLGITRADHVALRVADYDESVRFYTEKLGFQLTAEWTLGDAFPELRFAYLPRPPTTSARTTSISSANGACSSSPVPALART